MIYQILLEPRESKRVKCSIFARDLKFTDKSDKWILESDPFNFIIDQPTGTFELNK